MDTAFIGELKFLANERCEFIHVSDAFLHLVDYSDQELWEQFGNSLYALVHPEDLERIRRELDTQLATSSYYAINYRIRQKNGQMVWLHDQGQLLVQNGVSYFQSEIADVSRYFSQDSYYESILNALPTPIIITDEQRAIIFMNFAAEKDCGVSLFTCKGQPCSILDTPLCGTDACCLCQFERGENTTLQRTRDGRINRVFLSRRYGSDGKHAGFVSVSCDISGQIDAERQLKVADERYHLLLGQTRNLVWEYDLITRTVHLDQAHAPSFGSIHGFGEASSKLPEAMNAAGSLDATSAEELRRMYRALHAGEKTASCLVRQTPSEGGSRWMKITCNLLPHELGMPGRAVCVAQDVTIERELEQRYHEERLYRASLVSDAIAVYEVNLTHDTYHQLESDGTRVPPIKGQSRYSALIRGALSDVVDASHRQQVREQLARESLMAAYGAGQREVQLEYKRLDHEGALIWVRTTAHMIRSAPLGNLRAFLTVKNVNLQKTQELEQRKRSEHDPLTGLYNYAAALSRIEALLQLLRGESEHICALFMLDIDNFHQINDTYGHVYGDAVLAKLGKKLAGIFRKRDVLSRVGGDEFLVYLHDMPDRQLALEKAAQVCEQLQTVFSSSGAPCALSCSIGIVFAPDHGDSFQTLYERADIALYHAKSLGKNRYSVYETGLARDPNAHRDPIGSLPARLGLENNMFESLFTYLSQATEFDFAMNAALELIAQHFDVHHCYVYERTRLGNFSIGYEWCASGITSQKRDAQEVPADLFAQNRQEFDADGMLSIGNITNAPGQVRTLAQGLGIRAMLQCGIFLEDRLQALIGIDDFFHVRGFSEHERADLRSVTDILATFLERKRLLDRQTQNSSSLCALLDNLSDPTYLIAPEDWRLVFLSTSASARYRNARVGQHCYRALYGHERPCDNCPIGLFSREMTPQTSEVFDPLENQWIRTTAGPFTWGDGHDYCLLSCTDCRRPSAPPQQAT